MSTPACTPALLHQVYDRFATMFSRDGVNLHHHEGRWLALRPQDALASGTRVVLEDLPADARYSYEDFRRWALREAAGDELVFVRIEPTTIRPAREAAGRGDQPAGVQRAMAISVTSSCGRLGLRGGVGMRADGLAAGAYRPVPLTPPQPPSS